MYRHPKYRLSYREVSDDSQNTDFIEKIHKDDLYFGFSNRDYAAATNATSDLGASQ